MPKYINQGYYNQLKSEVAALDPDSLKKWLDHRKKQLAAIDNNTFEVSQRFPQHINDPIRFWSEEFRQVVKDFDTKKQN
jgi:hypothetical protein